MEKVRALSLANKNVSDKCAVIGSHLNQWRLDNAIFLQIYRHWMHAALATVPRPPSNYLSMNLA